MHKDTAARTTSRTSRMAVCSASKGLLSLPRTFPSSSLPFSLLPLLRRSRALCSMAQSSAEGDLVANLRLIQHQVDEARRPQGPPVTLVAVSKTKPVAMIQALYDAGHRHFGENYVNEIVEKAAQLPADIQWHFIGHLQSNKTKDLLMGVPNLAVLETVDTVKLANKLNNQREGNGPLEVYLQVDTSGEDTKSGVTMEEALSLFAHITENCPNLRVSGLMTIGEPGDMGCFDRLADCRRQICSHHGLEESQLQLSMGMSSDFEEAIRRGSTSVRVGSSLFGARIYPPK